MTNLDKKVNNSYLMSTLILKGMRHRPADLATAQSKDDAACLNKKGGLRYVYIGTKTSSRI